MKSTSTINKLMLAGILLIPALTAYAHDPGVSQGHLQIHKDNVSINLTFAMKDIELIVPMDGDHDGVVTSTEFTSNRPRVMLLAKQAVELYNNGQRLLPTEVSVSLSAKDTVVFQLLFPNQRSAGLSVLVPLIKGLARGHSHYLVIHDRQGLVIAQYVLNATTPLLSVPPTGIGLFVVLYEYVMEGVWHIWIGFDHILFLLTLLLPAVMVLRDKQWQSVEQIRPALMDVVKIVTAFTLAHSITLALAVLQVVVLPTRLVESAIAVSVLVTALNNLRPVFTKSRWMLAFVFGLIHGFGFAGVLIDLGLPSGALAVALLGFNLGVEAGQLAILGIVLPLAAFIRHTRFYQSYILTGGSTAAALVASIWIFERAFSQ